MQKCGGVISKGNSFKLDQCKKLCDDEADCKYFSIGINDKCRTHKSCTLDATGALRTIYKKKDGNGKLLINLQF